MYVVVTIEEGRKPNHYPRYLMKEREEKERKYNERKKAFPRQANDSMRRERNIQSNDDDENGGVVKIDASGK